jgi:hypothetical protein
MATVTISIPVRTHGDTGQRDQFEQHTKDFKVRYDGETVRLEAPTGYGSSIDFSEAELKQALDFIRDHTLIEHEPLNQARATKPKTPDPPCTGSGYAHKPHGNCPGYSTDRT